MIGAVQQKAFIEAAAGLRSDKARLPYTLDQDGRHVKKAVLSGMSEGDHDRYGLTNGRDRSRKSPWVRSHFGSHEPPTRRTRVLL